MVASALTLRRKGEARVRLQIVSTLWAQEAVFPLPRGSRRLARLPPTPRRAEPPRRDLRSREPLAAESKTRRAGPARPGPVLAVRGGGDGVELGRRTPPAGRARRWNRGARAKQWERPRLGSRAPAPRGPPRPPGPRAPRPAPGPPPPSLRGRPLPSAPKPRRCLPPSTLPAAAFPLSRSYIFSISLLFSEVVEMSYFNF